MNSNDLKSNEIPDFGQVKIADQNIIADEYQQKPSNHVQKAMSNLENVLAVLQEVDEMESHGDGDSINGSIARSRLNL